MSGWRGKWLRLDTTTVRGREIDSLRASRGFDDFLQPNFRSSCISREAVRSSVLDDHRMLFEQRNALRAREKKMHLPFQLPPVHSYRREFIGGPRSVSLRY